MARCDEGYNCEVCGKAVEEINESDLYLRYVIGEIEADALLKTPERHIRCNPVQAQFIVDERFEPVDVEGPFDKRQLDPDAVRQKEDLITRGWQRLQEIRDLAIPITEYPLQEIQEKRRLRS